MVTDLLQRLREREKTASKYGGFNLINPDGPEAADTIEGLMKGLKQTLIIAPRSYTRAIRAELAKIETLAPLSHTGSDRG